jgi:hypothetical protein
VLGRETRGGPDCDQRLAATDCAPTSGGRPLVALDRAIAGRLAVAQSAAKVTGMVTGHGWQPAVARWPRAVACIDKAWVFFGFFCNLILFF